MGSQHPWCSLLPRVRPDIVDVSESEADVCFVPDSLLRVCKVRLSHIGNNYPCLVDPSVGAVTNQNSSKIFFEDANKKPGTYAEMSLKQVKNYGTGTYHPDGGLDPDTVQALWTSAPGVF